MVDTRANDSPVEYRSAVPRTDDPPEMYRSAVARTDDSPVVYRSTVARTDAAEQCAIFQVDSIWSGEDGLHLFVDEPGDGPHFVALLNPLGTPDAASAASAASAPTPARPAWDIVQAARDQLMRKA